MSDHLEKAKIRAEERFAKTQRRSVESEKAMMDYRSEVQAVRDKTARLRAMRLEKEAAEAAEAALAAPKPTRKKASTKAAVPKPARKSASVSKPAPKTKSASAPKVAALKAKPAPKATPAA